MQLFFNKTIKQIMRLGTSKLTWAPCLCSKAKSMEAEDLQSKLNGRPGGCWWANKLQFDNNK